MNIMVFDHATAACTYVAGKLAELAAAGGTVALSGGSTPKLLFKIMGEQFPGANWGNLKFFWGDERMVPAESSESNYGEFYRTAVQKGVIPDKAVFATDYFPDTTLSLKKIEDKIKGNVPFLHGLPQFDLILLGVGEDGHVASIFPDNIHSFSSSDVVEVVSHPVSGQKRITITGSVINNAREVILLCTGAAKKEIIYNILIDKNVNLPATHVATRHGNTEWCMDGAAAQNIKGKTEAAF